jgi:hypothetical protein
VFTKRSHIEQVSKIDLPKAMLTLLGERLFALTPSENCLFDISNKHTPILVSKFTLRRDEYVNTFLGFNNKIAYFSIGYSGIEAVDFKNESMPSSFGLANVLTGIRSAFYDNRYFITNPKIPRIYQIASPTEFNTVFEFSEWMSDYVLAQNFLCGVILKEGIKVYDISDPSQPRHVSSLNLNILRLVTVSPKSIVAEGADGVVYILDLSNLPDIGILSQFEIPGPIAAGSLTCKNDLLLVRFMRRVVADTTYAFDITDLRRPKRIFNYKSKGIPFFSFNEKLLVFMGIKGWDGSSNATGNYDTNIYEIFAISDRSIKHVDDIQLKGVWLSSVLALDRFVYLAREDAIYIYEVTV